MSLKNRQFACPSFYNNFSFVFLLTTLFSSLAMANSSYEGKIIKKDAPSSHVLAIEFVDFNRPAGDQTRWATYYVDDMTTDEDLDSIRFKVDLSKSYLPAAEDLYQDLRVLLRGRNIICSTEDSYFSWNKKWIKRLKTGKFRMVYRCTNYNYVDTFPDLDEGHENDPIQEASLNGRLSFGCKFKGFQNLN